MSSAAPAWYPSYAGDADAADSGHLPEPARLEDTVAEVDARPVPEPDGGVQPEVPFLLRYGAP